MGSTSGFANNFNFEEPLTTLYLSPISDVDETYSFLSSWILLLINLYLLTTSSYSALEIILFS